jgi:hypothetical protein
LVPGHDLHKRPLFPALGGSDKEGVGIGADEFLVHSPVGCASGVVGDKIFRERLKFRRAGETAQ